MATYINRIADHTLATDMTAFAGVLITGPRGVGKSRMAGRIAASTLQLDANDDRSLVLADPDGAISGRAHPLLIDEWQLAPDVLRAVKRSVDQGDGPGRFIVTGSARNDLLQDLWPTTGRLIRHRLWGLTGRELYGTAAAPSLFDRWNDPDQRFVVPESPPTLRDYIRIALRSGFPDAAQLNDVKVAQRWLRSYVDEVATSDLRTLSAPGTRLKDPARFKSYLEAYSLNTAGVTPHSTIYERAAINKATANAYLAALVSLGVVQELPAWGTNRQRRLFVERAKRYVVDAGIAAAAAGVTVDDVYAEDDLRGRIIDTFVAAQLRVEAEASEGARLLHLRTRNGEHEVDIVAEYRRKLYGFEIKAGNNPDRTDARHLIWFRDEIGAERFGGGVVFHTGPHRYEIDEQIEAVPIAGLWG